MNGVPSKIVPLQMIYRELVCINVNTSIAANEVDLELGSAHVAVVLLSVEVSERNDCNVELWHHLVGERSLIIAESWMLRGILDEPILIPAPECRNKQVDDSAKNSKPLLTCVEVVLGP